MSHDDGRAILPDPRPTPSDRGRREAMLKLGKGIAYAAPLTLGLLKVDKAAAAS
jgi:hypothetical protein